MFTGKIRNSNLEQIYCHMSDNGFVIDEKTGQFLQDFTVAIDIGRYHKVSRAVQPHFFQP